MPSLPSNISTTPHSLESFANLLRVHSVPLSVSLIKMSKSPGPSTDPWETPLNTTGFHLDAEPLATTLWVRLSSQFLIDQVVPLSNPCGFGLATRMSCGQCRVLYPSQGRWHIALPLSTSAVTRIMEDQQVSQAQFALRKSCSSVTVFSTCLSITSRRIYCMEVRRD